MQWFVQNAGERGTPKRMLHDCFVNMLVKNIVAGLGRCPSETLRDFIKEVLWKKKS